MQRTWNRGGNRSAGTEPSSGLSTAVGGVATQARTHAEARPTSDDRRDTTPRDQLGNDRELSDEAAALLRILRTAYVRLTSDDDNVMEQARELMDCVEALCELKSCPAGSVDALHGRVVRLDLHLSQFKAAIEEFTKMSWAAAFVLEPLIARAGAVPNPTSKFVVGGQ